MAIRCGQRHCTPKTEGEADASVSRVLRKERFIFISTDIQVQSLQAKRHQQRREEEAGSAQGRRAHRRAGAAGKDRAPTSPLLIQSAWKGVADSPATREHAQLLKGNICDFEPGRKF